MTEIEKDAPEPASEEISCETCVAACCRAGMTFMLSETEVSIHRRQMRLKSILKPRDYAQRFPVDAQRLDANGNIKKVRTNLPIPKRTGFYILLTDCGNIAEDNSCANYENRPQSCRTYEIGSEECRAARAEFGLDGHEYMRGDRPIETTEPIKVTIPRFEAANPSAPPSWSA